MTLKNIDIRDRIILALDVDSPAKAKDLIARTESHLGFYKVGLQLFLAGGFDIVDWIVDRGHKVMLDLKLHDISATVALAVEQLAGHGVYFATVHGEPPVVRAAAAAAGDRVRILAVTVLTSLGEDDLRSVGITMPLPELVRFRARAALEAGCSGVVASGHEAAMLRRELGEDFFIVTPGIRQGNTVMNGSDDQTRIMTAGAAIENGANHVVVGRPISKATDPVAVIEEMQKGIVEGVSGS
ncbi:MAG: orotidine-5'-phosphate decarboxylase [Proteobacteria bacterium]|nr:orotidine-5'-phosphate decarboxylase [Pseudomonadota bacterium]MBU1736794.1 orotidine-5'-phosphate decarboxylase [Pseudomonadota bacterium]